MESVQAAIIRSEHSLTKQISVVVQSIKNNSHENKWRKCSCTKGGEGGGVQAVPWEELAFRRWRPVRDEDVVVVITREWQRESGHPGRVTELVEDVICREIQTHK